MRAIIVRCPNCGASLTVDDGATSVACQYCGTSSRIQTRSRVLQVPRRLPPEPGPVARQPFNRAVLIGPILFIILSVVVSAVIFARAAQPRHVATTSPPATAQPAHAPPAAPPIHPDTWATGIPLVTDVDGDGADDLIGLTRNVHDGDRAQLAAFSGATGAPLWTGASLGSYSEAVQLAFYFAGDQVLVATPAGELRSFSRTDGAPRWTTSLGERVNAACIIPGAGGQTTAEAGAVLIGTNDRRWHSVALADGTRTETAEPRRPSPRDRGRTSLAWVEGKLPAGYCLPLASSGRDALPGLATADSWSKLPTIPGMSVARIVRRADGPIVAIGAKSPGTAVPMLAVLDARAPRWTATVPLTDPLEARAEPTHVALSPDAVFQVWEGKDGPHLAAFDLADGRRRWDVALDKQQARVVVGAIVVGDRVIVAGWDGLLAFDTRDGTLAYSLAGR